MTRPIFLLTDFGVADTYVGIVKAVILGVAPEATLVDLTHEIQSQGVRAGAFALLTVVRYLPNDAVVLAVVDPGVGTDRRPIAIQVGNLTFVGPDNGLLAWAVQALTDSTAQIVVLDRPEFWLPSISATFHGRDLFGPVVAHLARGAQLTDVGTVTDSMVTLPFPTPKLTRSAAGEIVRAEGEVIYVDHYGNLISNLRAADLPPNPRVTIDGQRIEGIAPHYQTAGGGGLIALIGSAGFLEVAVPNGSAARAFNLAVEAPVTVTTTSYAPRPL